MTTRKELIEGVGARYRGSSVSERTKILDEFVAITGPPQARYPRPGLGPVRTRMVSLTNQLSASARCVAR